ncbi:MAG: energy transducer TonB [Bacteroidetes bacterium]|nr:energy transducer TonB [Bacteroidota bacterium]
MKNIIILLPLFLMAFTSYSQDMNFGIGGASSRIVRDLSYEIRGTYSHPVKKEQLNSIKTMSDIIPEYPSAWITNYVSVEISATCDGKSMKAVSTNSNLNMEQRKLVTNADIGSDIIIDIIYKSRNAVTENLENNKLHYSISVVPEIEAVYNGGNQQMTQYLKENAINKIPKSKAEQFQITQIRFTVNEEGKITNAKVAKTSDDTTIDKLLLNVINNMPNWKPAENSKGVKVKQDFVFSVGNSGC